MPSLVNENSPLLAAVGPGSKTCRIDFSDLSGGFDLLAVANVPTDRKAGEFKVVIDGLPGSEECILADTANLRGEPRA